ncbi:UNVERIFIED_CONTAM: hypothetical protein Sradi_2137100 [Sesamum radiatum]|uniref:CCHC-type domain-containing protein n=1 Tax=Sesamum radiatum TaxID=300843 RepID=A0AAW2TKC2_SESRA
MGRKEKVSVYSGGVSRSTKRKIDRSFSTGGGNFLRGGPTFRGTSGQKFSGPMGFNRGSTERSSFAMLPVGSDATPRICYNCGGRGHISRDCSNQTLSLSGSASRGTQGQSSIGSSGRGAERGRGKGRGTGNRDGDHTIGGGMRGFGAQVTQGQIQARIYNMTREEAQALNDVISCTIFLFDIEAFVLINPGSMHSYISSELASKIPSENSPLGYNLMVYLPVGGGLVVNSVRKGSLVKIEDVTLPVDLVVMNLKEFDVILGMDWLAQNRAVVDCYKKEVMIESLGQPKVVFVEER